MTVLESLKNIITDNINKNIKKFIVYPYGICGYMTKKVIDSIDIDKFEFAVDDSKCLIYDYVKNFDYLEKYNVKENTAIIIATHNNQLFNILFDKVSKLNKFNIINAFPLKVGKHSWGPLINENGYLIESIGSFCSFADGVHVVANHNMNQVSTCSLFNGIDLDISEHFFKQVENVPLERVMNHKKTVIGNDVWLGRNVIVCNGADIGNGVIAAAGSVIINDIPEYAVVGGVPAKVIKYRYTRDIIEKLNYIKWWDWTDECIAQRFKDFYDIDAFLKKYF
ncbi:CatB-related O-acetyltransferase [Peptoanaerobacter stomatis]|uniref:CatB-related O-acetyltransferase n=1 Tax=Peptoanaerobacter stomatis TaxID=796937 RepID=UPI003F9F4AE3